MYCTRRCNDFFLNDPSLENIHSKFQFFEHGVGENDIGDVFCGHQYLFGLNRCW